MGIRRFEEYGRSNRRLIVKLALQNEIGPSAAPYASKEELLYVIELLETGSGPCGTLALIPKPLFIPKSTEMCPGPPSSWA